MRLLNLHHFFPSFSFTCDPSLPWAVLIFLAVPPSQAVNFQRLWVKPQRDLSCGTDGRLETAAAIETQLLIGIDRATHVREQQSGAFTWGGQKDTVHRSGCSSRPHHRYTRHTCLVCVCVCVCVCGCWCVGVWGLIPHNSLIPRQDPYWCFCNSLTCIQRIRGKTPAAPHEEQRPFCQGTEWLTGADNKAREGRHWRIAASVMECSWGRVAIESSF